MNLNLIGSGLLALLGLPLIFRYGILPGNSTPYWLFTVLLFLVFGNVLLAYNRKQTRNYTILLLAAIVLLVMWTQISNRGRVAPGQNMGTHDVILQLEAALRFLGDGKNPYAVTYFGTPVEQWHYAENLQDSINPALYHNVMPPWYLVFAYPFYFISMRTLGYFDGRLPLLFCVIGLMVFIPKLFRNKDLGTIAAVLVVLAPGTVDYMIEGRSDLFALFWVVASCLLLWKKHYAWSFALFALAFWSKQTVWIMAPLFFLFGFASADGRWKKLIQPLLVFIGISAVLAGPFLIWDWRAFLDSTVFYLSGNSRNGYPVSGYGLGMLLYSMGVIRNIHDYFPFALWQLAIGIPAFVISAKYLARNPSISRLLLANAVVLFVVWYTSRYFNNSHALYIATLFMLAVLKNEDERIAQNVQS
jgi:hypothetical protein